MTRCHTHRPRRHGRTRRPRAEASPHRARALCLQGFASGCAAFILLMIEVVLNDRLVRVRSQVLSLSLSRAVRQGKKIRVKCK